MALEDVVRLTITRTSRALERPGFGTLLVLAAHRLWEDRQRLYTDVDGLDNDGASANESGRRAASAYFSQDPKPRRMRLGRRATTDAVTVNVETVTPFATYTVRIGGLIHTIAAPGPTATAAQVAAMLAVQLNGGYEITAADSVTDYFEIAGDHVSEFPVGTQFTVRASTAAPTNDGTYTVTAVGLVAGNTRVSVAAVPTTEAAGAGTGHLGGYGIIGVSTVNETFTVAGDMRTRFPAGLALRVVGSTGNDGAWVVASTALDGSGNTVITVTGNVTNAVVDGGITSAADGSGIAAASRSRVQAALVAGNAFLTLTPATASQFYTARAESKLRLGFTTSDTPTNDLNAVRDSSDDWYFVVLGERVVADVMDLAARIEQLRREFVTATSDANAVNVTAANDSPATGSVPARLRGLSYARTAALYSAQATGTLAGAAADTYPDAAWIGTRATTNPGSETWKFMSLAGVLSDNLTSTQRQNGLDKGANLYVPITSARNITEQGTVANGEYIDLIRFVDWLHSEMTRGVFDALANPPAPQNKIPYDDSGIAIIKAAMGRTLEAGTRAGGIAKKTDGTGDYDVTVPAVADTAFADRAGRVLRNARFRARAAGAIHDVEITGNVSV